MKPLVMGGWLVVCVLAGCKSGDKADKADKVEPPATTQKTTETTTESKPPPSDPAPPASPTDATVLAANVNDPRVVIVAGDHVFWIENRDNTRYIKSVPVSGGEVKTVVAIADFLQPILAADATSLYFVIEHKTDDYEIDKVGFDGANRAALASGVPVGRGGGPDLVVRDGALYWGGLKLAGTSLATGIWSMPATPTDPPTAAKIIFPAGYDGVSLPTPGMVGITEVDASGFYYTMISQQGAGILMSAPERKTPVQLFIDDLSESMTPQVATIHVRANSDVWFVTGNKNTKPRSSALWKAAGGKAAATKVAELPGIEAQYMVADARGMYMNNTSHQGKPMGIYAVSENGEATLVATTPQMSVLAEPRMVALDDKRIYFVDGGHNAGIPNQPGNATIYSKPR